MLKKKIVVIVVIGVCILSIVGIYLTKLSSSSNRKDRDISRIESNKDSIDTTRDFIVENYDEVESTTSEIETVEEINYSRYDNTVKITNENFEFTLLTLLKVDDSNVNLVENLAISDNYWKKLHEIDVLPNVKPDEKIELKFGGISDNGNSYIAQIAVGDKVGNYEWYIIEGTISNGQIDSLLYYKI